MREPPNIPEEYLRACFQEQYDISAVSFEFLPLGLDNRAGVYHVVSEQGSPYLLKARSGSFYESSCLVPRYLWERVVQDLIYDAEEVFLRDDLGEASKSAAAKSFNAILSGEGNGAEKAFAASAHLAIDLRFQDKELPGEH